jgi:hypothetical protein
VGIRLDKRELPLRIRPHQRRCCTLQKPAVLPPKQPFRIWLLVRDLR